MGTLVCQDCNATVDQFEAEKVKVLYCECEVCKSGKNINVNHH